ncbi:IDEAL domain-containing protein [Paenibacillus sp. JSM ZJ436]|uniref:IDEAL domain-containing protein n=1 Tax=Paenibacillus sp. JSM ZJ436 TaxID=3376190 RepID=UPI0037CA94AE
MSKAEVLDILTKHIIKDQKRFPVNIQTCINWYFVDYDRSKSEWFIDPNARKDIKIVQYKDGYRHTYLTIEAVTGLLQREFPDASNIHIDIRIKDNNALLRKDTIEEVINSMNFKAIIEFDNEVLPTKSDLQQLIDLALDMGNEQLFMEYSAQYNAYCMI